MLALMMAALSVREVSAPPRKIDLVVGGVFGLMCVHILAYTIHLTYWFSILLCGYLCLALVKSSTLQFWASFRTELSSLMFRVVYWGAAIRESCNLPLSG